MEDNTKHMEEEDIEKEALKLSKESLDEIDGILGNAFTKALKLSFDAVLLFSGICLAHFITTRFPSLH